MENNRISIFKNKQDCCGCTACMTVCPKSAISMKPDENGFLYPVIDNDKCIKCELFIKTCAFQNGYDTSNNLDEPLVYAVKHKNQEERNTSRSGGMFVAIADWILSQNGVIYGVGYGDNFYVMHKRVSSKEQLFELKGSKYVQSDMNTVFSQVIQDLKDGKYVLFSGTACQTAGLYSSLKNIDTQKLFICDIVCHGTPSPYIWRDYLKFTEKKYKSSITNVNFRNKSYGWHSHIESLCLENGNKFSTNIYSYLFGKCIMFRPSCGYCKYTNTTRPSDITLADFWGIEKAVPNFDDDKGVSLVFLNTKKGKSLFNNIKDNVEYQPSKLEDCMQPNLQHPSVFSTQYDDFWKDYQNNGFEYVSRKYGNNNIKVRTKRLIKKILGKSEF